MVRKTHPTLVLLFLKLALRTHIFSKLRFAGQAHLGTEVKLSFYEQRIFEEEIAE
jgi:hypothetical protein